MTLSFPPFTRAVKWIIGINVGVYFLLSLMGLSGASAPLAGLLFQVLALTPDLIVRGWLWQAITYSFVHVDLLSLIFSMLGMWFLGSMLESTFGTRRFLRYYAICVLGAAAAGTALAYSGVVANAAARPMVGAQGAFLGFLIAFGILFAETEFMMLPFPFHIKAKYLAGMTIVIVVLISLREPAGLLQLAQLGGAVAGAVYIKFFYGGRTTAARPYAGRGLADRSALGRGGKPQPANPFRRLSDAYYRWKRRRAARKFEVYMRKHDRNVHFDAHGNYVPPEEKEKGDGEGKGGWVN